MKSTPLAGWHESHGAKMIDFHGWKMPIQYSGILEEHMAVRENVGIFDVSHMGEFMITGPGCVDFLDYLTCNDVRKLIDGQAQYTAILTEAGTFIDDLTIYRFSDTKFMACVNSANEDKDFFHFEEVASHFDVSLENISDKTALVALQGKKAVKLMTELMGTLAENLKFYHFTESQIAGVPITLARMGYTGEDGYEVFIPADKANHVWSKIFEIGESHGLIPAGLGARDSLRTEVCYPLYGQDIHIEVDPLSAGLGWIAKLKKEKFIGKIALEAIKREGPKTKLVAFSMIEKGVPRKGQDLWDEKNLKIGTVCSGTFSPVIEKGIGMGYVPANFEGKLFVYNGRRTQEVRIEKPPIIKIQK